MNRQLDFYKNKLAFETDPADLHQDLKNNEPVTAIDTRTSHAFGREHITGAVSLPHRKMSEESTSGLDKTRTYICYCDGIGCNASTKGALKMTELGFRVRELIGGIQWWKLDGHPTEGSRRKLC